MEFHFENNSLVVLCGPAGSGKSYFAQRHFPCTVIVSSDRCREMISNDPGEQKVSADAFDLYYRIVGYRLKHGRLAVADATNIEDEYRRNLWELAKTHGRPMYLVLFDATFEECMRNDAMRDRHVEECIVRLHLDKFARMRYLLADERSRYAEVYNLKPSDMAAVVVKIQGGG